MSFKPLMISSVNCFASLVIATAVFVGSGALGERGKWRVANDEWRETRQMHETASARQLYSSAIAQAPESAAGQASGSAIAQATTTARTVHFMRVS